MSPRSKSLSIRGASATYDNQDPKLRSEDQNSMFLTVPFESKQTDQCKEYVRSSHVHISGTMKQNLMKQQALGSLSPGEEDWNRDNRKRHQYFLVLNSVGKLCGWP